MTREQVLETLNNGIFIRSYEDKWVWKEGVPYCFGKTAIILDDNYLHCLFYQGNQLTSSCSFDYRDINHMSIKKTSEKNAVVFISQEVHYISK